MKDMFVGFDDISIEEMEKVFGGTGMNKKDYDGI